MIHCQRRSRSRRHMNCNCTFPESAESQEKKVTSSNFSQQKAEVMALFPQSTHDHTPTQNMLNNTKETVNVVTTLERRFDGTTYETAHC